MFKVHLCSSTNDADVIEWAVSTIMLHVLKVTQISILHLDVINYSECNGMFSSIIYVFAYCLIMNLGFYGFQMYFSEFNSFKC